MNTLTQGSSYSLNALILTSIPMLGTAQITKASLPTLSSIPKKEVPSVENLEKENNNPINPKLDKPNGKYSEAQVTCAERLQIDISECNRHGVFTDRDPFIKDDILKASAAKSWDTITPKQLKAISKIKLNLSVDIGIQKINLDGLSPEAIVSILKNKKVNILENETNNKIFQNTLTINRFLITLTIITSLATLTTYIIIGYKPRF